MLGGPGRWRVNSHGYGLVGFLMSLGSGPTSCCSLLSLDSVLSSFGIRWGEAPPPRTPLAPLGRQQTRSELMWVISSLGLGAPTLLRWTHRPQKSWLPSYCEVAFSGGRLCMQRGSLGRALRRVVTPNLPLWVTHHFPGSQSSCDFPDFGEWTGWLAGRGGVCSLAVRLPTHRVWATEASAPPCASAPGRRPESSGACFSFVLMLGLGP